MVGQTDKKYERKYTIKEAAIMRITPLRNQSIPLEHQTTVQLQETLLRLEKWCREIERSPSPPSLTTKASLHRCLVLAMGLGAQVCAGSLDGAIPLDSSLKNLYDWLQHVNDRVGAIIVAF